VSPLSNEKQSWLACRLDPTGLGYVKASGPKNLAFEAINGSLSIRVNWTTEARASEYKPTDSILLLEAVVLGLILEELLDVSKKIAESHSGPFNVALHRTIPPLQFSIEGKADSVAIRLLEFSKHPNESVVLGGLELPRGPFFLNVANLVEGFLKDLVSANPSLQELSGHEEPTKRHRKSPAKG